MDILHTNAVTLPLTQLTPNEGQIVIDGERVAANPRYITDDEYAALKESIKADNLTGLNPLKVYEYKGQYVVIGGNMRLRAMRELGIVGTSCIIIPQDATAEVLRKEIITDNATFGKWDYDALANEWDEQELRDWGVELPDMVAGEDEGEIAQEDDFNESKYAVETRCKKGDVWQLGAHRLMCGDSTSENDVAVLMDSAKADMVLTDPPYNVQYIGKTKEELTIENDRFESDAEFQVFITTALSNAKDYLKDGGAFYIWTTQGHAMYDITKAADDAGLHFRQQLIWHKNHFVMGRMDYHGKHEPCLYGWKDGAGHYFTSDRTQTTIYEDVVEIDKLKKDELRKMLHDILDAKEPTTILNCERPVASHEHPTMKPIKLMGMCITNSSRKGESVLDLFGGSGSTLIACEQLGRKCYMVELDPHYCDVIIARWEKLTDKTAVKL